MQYINRDIEKLVLDLSQEYSCVLITGPRQVGKTTMLKHIMGEDRRVVSLDDAQERQLAKRDPAMFLELNPAPILIDEVQKAPELFEYIKICIDNGAPAGSFWLTGSQSFKLMTLAQESLAGRVALLRMTGLSQHEMYGSGDATPFEIDINSLQSRKQQMQSVDILGLYDRIWKGSMPGYASGKFTNRDVFYSSYLQTYISRDIREETNLADEGVFLDFIRAAACRAGQVLNVHSIAVDVGVSDDTAKRWLTLLEKSDIVFYLHPYSNNLLKRTIKQPKMYFFDTGLVAYLTKYSSAEILLNGSLNGAILENYVVSEIIKTYQNLGKDCLLHYYRDKDNNEIDLIIEDNGSLSPIEIKKSSNPSESIVSAFAILNKSTMPVGKGAVVCAKDNVSAIDSNNLIVPIWCI